jgi:hypothetical protein
MCNTIPHPKNEMRPDILDAERTGIGQCLLQEVAVAKEDVRTLALKRRRLNRHSILGVSCCAALRTSYRSTVCMLVWLKAGISHQGSHDRKLHITTHPSSSPTSVARLAFVASAGYGESLKALKLRC